MELASGHGFSRPARDFPDIFNDLRANSSARLKTVPWRAVQTVFQRTARSSGWRKATSGKTVSGRSRSALKVRWC